MKLMQPEGRSIANCQLPTDFFFLEQVELIGKGDPLGEEHDVRIAHAEIYGKVASFDVDIESRALVPMFREH
jgi:hypothetical protein